MKSKLSNLIQKLTNPEFIKYFISGVSAFLIDLAVLNFFVFVAFSGEDEFLFDTISISKTVSSAVGISVSFLLNRAWTFKATGGSLSLHVLKYGLMVGFNFAFSVLLYSLFYIISTEIGISTELAVTSSNVATEAVKMITSFILFKYFVFKK